MGSLTVTWVLGWDPEDGDALAGRTLARARSVSEAEHLLTIYGPAALHEEQGRGEVVVLDEHGHLVDPDLRYAGRQHEVVEAVMGMLLD